MRNAELAEKHAGLVKTVAQAMRRRLPRRTDIQELESAGTLGLVDAAERFEPERGVKFSAWASIKIRGAILDHLRRERHMPRKYPPDVTARLEHRVLCAHHDACMRRDARANRTGQERVDAADTVTRLMSCLTPREQSVIRMLYFEGMNQRAIAANMCVSETLVSLAHKRALERMHERAAQLN
jgi:RNA polymerase sigma factor (sigma-70 family)